MFIYYYLEFIPKNLKLNVNEEFEIYYRPKTHKTNPAQVLNDQTSLQANIIFDCAIHINPRQYKC